MNRQEESLTWKHLLPISAIVLGACFVMLASTGCTNPNAGKYGYLAHKNYMEQPRTGDTEKIVVGVGGEYSLIIKGPVTVTRSMPLRELASIPKDPNVVNTGIEWLGRIGLGWIVGGAFADAAAGPTVVNQPAPLVVEQQIPFLVPTP